MGGRGRGMGRGFDGVMVVLVLLLSDVAERWAVLKL